MSLSEAKRRANDKYIANNYTRLPISYPNEFAEAVRSAAADAGQSLAGYVRQAIEMRMKADAYQTAKVQTAQEQTETESI